MWRTFFLEGVLMSFEIFLKWRIPIETIFVFMTEFIIWEIRINNAFACYKWERSSPFVRPFHIHTHKQYGKMVSIVRLIGFMISFDFPSFVVGFFAGFLWMHFFYCNATYIFIQFYVVVVMYEKRVVWWSVKQCERVSLVWMVGSLVFKKCMTKNDSRLCRVNNVLIWWTVKNLLSVTFPSNHVNGGKWLITFAISVVQTY